MVNSYVLAKISDKLKHDCRKQNIYYYNNNNTVTLSLTDTFGASTACRLLRSMSVLNLLLPECLIEFCKMIQLLSLRAKSYDVTIQMKTLCLYLHIVLFVIQNFTKMLLAKFGSERIKESQIQCIGSKCPLRERVDWKNLKTPFRQTTRRKRVSLLKEKKFNLDKNLRIV